MPSSYTNADNTTDLSVSVAGAGDLIKIGLSPGSDPNADAIAQYITDCLAAGETVDITWAGSDGSSGSGTITGQAGAFPGFNGPGTFTSGGQSAKLSSMTAVCSSEADACPPCEDAALPAGPSNSTETEPACAEPKPILQLDNGYAVELCTPNGPIAVHFQIPAAADDCPPDAPGDPAIVGWTDLTTGAFTAATAAPADAVPCGETADFEAVRWCGLDADGEPVGDLLVEYEYDEDTRALIGSKVLNPDGTPYSGPAYVTIGRCNDVANEYTTVRECRNGTVHSVTRSIDRDQIVTEVEAVDTGEVCGQPIVDVDVEWYCNEATDTWFTSTVTTTDGVAAPAVVVDTGIACADAAVDDFEQVRVCRNDTVHVVTNQIDADGVVTEVGAVDTGEACSVNVWRTRAVQSSGTAVLQPTPNGSVRSYTVTVEAGRANVTPPGGGLINIRRGSRTWTAHDDDFVDGLPRVQGTTTNADFDIIWEER